MFKSKRKLFIVVGRVTFPHLMSTVVPLEKIASSQLVTVLCKFQKKYCQLETGKSIASS